MKKLWIAIVKLFGWKFDLPPADDLKRLHHCVLIEAPHTSIYDFLLGAACVWRMGLNARFFIKKEFFVFPLRHFLKWSGALPIDRGNKNNHMVDKAVEAFGKNDDFTVIITPEGTRKQVKRFKRGFYEIATNANVPIAITYINYKTRHMGVGPLIMPSGDFDADMRIILDFYSNVAPRNDKGWNIELLKSTYREK
ncbi:MAG: 1-acyl-sn-glycerol-3-phosphate acyltransferase [Bacteroidales bacterium]|jgi:1-acyl-sn-glycerol-3-phosphate acyltransferase|nr:1-acyl-sn-glycerol-3-phosphate acyltransferase [Bacteroidales bacterium]MBR4714693.1 1-acyl-sn-glycerol-3-phosphate acyltransferase [Bacteroidales bacterium]